ncbi:hypothetical protein HCA61_25670, partial [Rhodococcus sp. HNM0563]|uniref:condensation domain-containing protein n=1 Tax=Rhodococcus sp. HNM0563 TaxID=2716339 RepID=UPI00146A7253
MPVSSCEFALTSAQQAIWYAQQFSDTSLRNLAAYIDISGSISALELERSIRSALHENENLLVRITDSGDGPVQVAHSFEDWRPSHRDFTRHESPQSAALAWAKSLADEVIPPTDSPLFKVAILRVEARRYYIVLVFNHVVIDAAGLALLVGRIGDIYDGAPQGRTSTLSVLADADNEYRRSSKRRDDEQFWANYAVRSVGTVRSVKPHGDQAVRSLELTLPITVTTRLSVASKRNGITLPSALAALGALMIAKQTGRQRFYIQIPVANRNGSIGDRPNLLANRIPLEVTLDNAAAVAAWLREFNVEVVVALEHGQLASPEICRVAGVLQEGPEFFGPIVNVVPFSADPRLGESARIRPLAIGPFDNLSVSLIVYSDVSVVVHLEAEADTFSDADLNRYAGDLADLAEKVSIAMSENWSVEALMGTDNSLRGDEPLLHWQPPITPRSQDTVYARPTTENEAALAGIFGEVLAVDHVGIDDNFFDLGGNSLLATKIANRLRMTLGVDLPIRTIFEGQSVRALAPHLRAPVATGRQQLVPRDRSQDAPLSFAQQRLWFLHRVGEASTGYNMVFALKLTGPLDVDALSRAINDVVDRHDVLRTIFEEDEGVPYQRILEPTGSRILLEIVDSELNDVAGALADHCFDLKKELPIAARLLAGMASEEHTLILVAHHIAGDGWSLVPLLRDLGIAYRARV